MSRHLRLGNLEMRQESAKARQLEHNKLSIAERIAKLDKKFGKDIGGTKERARLLKKNEAPKPVPKVEVKKDVQKEKTPKEKFVKKYNKKPIENKD